MQINVGIRLAKSATTLGSRGRLVRQYFPNKIQDNATRAAREPNTPSSSKQRNKLSERKHDLPYVLIRNRKKLQLIDTAAVRYVSHCLHYYCCDRDPVSSSSELLHMNRNKYIHQFIINISIGIHHSPSAAGATP